MIFENRFLDLLEKPEDESDINATLKAKLFYQSCMNEELIEQKGESNFLAILNDEFGGWPLIADNSLKNSMTIIERLVNMRRLGFKPFIDIHVTSNPKNPLTSILKVNLI